MCSLTSPSQLIWIRTRSRKSETLRDSLVASSDSDSEGLVSVKSQSIKLHWEEQGSVHGSRFSTHSKQHLNDVFQVSSLDLVEKAKSPILHSSCYSLAEEDHVVLWK